ncbi:hypothetical protein SLS62_010324 [Diatrype stigma]|uniref:SPRY domain-containing protein n=1 Tax=Diatrype stigma TaxID=117547 RepID=A0AAN9U9A9_9PEZI
MCFGSKDNRDSHIPASKPAQIPLNQQQPATSKPPPLASKANYNSSNNNNLNMAPDYAPPQGPPPPTSAYAYADAAPPPGPPPSHSGSRPHNAAAAAVGDAVYQPPPGPPPASTSNSNSNSGYDYAPPAGPPPQTTDAKNKNNPFFNGNGGADAALPPPKDWEAAVPDTSLLPPPPDYFGGFDRSPANNATEAEAEAGERWCADYPLYAPLALDSGSAQQMAAAVAQGDVRVFAPPFFRGTLGPTARGVWRGRSGPGSPDVCLATYPPLWSAAAAAAARNRNSSATKTIYYEVRILPSSSHRQGEVSLAIGLAAPPYPPFRLPGWHRASAAVHGDDGRRYVNDRWGGRTFVAPFRRGETVGFGARFAPGAAGLGVRAEYFFTRGGREEGRWDLHEETDGSEDLPVDGLEGASRDLCAAVGVFDEVAFEIVFRPELCAFRPEGL